jgi:enolase
MTRRFSMITSGAIITGVRGRQILDSRGRPTVEVEVGTRDGSLGRASAPSGASTGRYEALELRDGDAARFQGRSVSKALANVHGEIAHVLLGRPAVAQAEIDRTLIGLDGTTSLSRLGANAVVATSVAVARAGAAHREMPLHRYLQELGGGRRPLLPMPMTNILSGGAHAGRGMDFQDFLAVPVGARSYSQALDMVSRVRASAAELMQQQGLSTLLADEGGLAPGFARAEQALELMLRSFELAGLKAGDDVAIAIDVAASELCREGAYELAAEARRLSGAEMVELMCDLACRYPVVSIEDPLDQDDVAHWQALTARVPQLQLIGDDLVATNGERLAAGIAAGTANAILIKINQNGTLTGTLDVMRAARAAGYATVVSARSGETEDAFIADLAVGTGCGQIKIGSVRNSERLAKYNQLLRLEEEGIAFAGRSGLCPID